MDRQWWIFLAALVVAMIGGSNPGKRHDDKIDKLNDDSDNHLRFVMEDMSSGNAAWATNTNLVGIRIVLNRINMGVWAIVGLLIVLAAPRFV
ncbi:MULTISPECIES: hypothetical protein [Rhizobium]|uniref:hypothetical protein n=1 Tax=Rhizobium TaxID=379 RepID=UPI0007E93921|nr:MULTISPECIES: hypothetical protein [Rhizobium]ANK97594.1 hypothetical protein AMK00_CH02104 [Rhizobium sp. N621]ANL03674.1 hypothetical protein AMJ99_CH02132 [Rhizobium esperanzae]ANL09720.1 hypothetical protein AMJ98_CH02054 [Rhizobium sp. N1341]ANM34523.1 hypothetical protein AMK04_CH02134 [Rhizobium sp. N871]ANM40561.1 hypothetical protein AMK03_CH02054 [Rhizobium sp. N741]